MARSKTQRDHERQALVAERQIDDVMRRIARAVTSLKHWQRRARYHSAQALITDEERKALREQQRAQRTAKQRTRRIIVAED